MDIGRQFLHTMGKSLLLEAQEHIDNAMDAYSEHYPDPSSYEDPEDAQLEKRENADTAMTKAVMINIGMHGAHNSGQYQKAHELLSAVHYHLDKARKSLPSGDAEHAYPVYQALRTAQSKIRDVSDRYATLMSTEPPRE